MNLPRKRMSSAGFTLLELMIVVTIIAVVSAAVIPAFSGYTRNQNLKQAQEQLKSDMRTVQNKALTGALADRQLGGEYIKYWGIKFVSSSNSYEYFVSVNTVCPAAIAAEAFQGKGSFGSSLVTRSASGCLFFDVSNGDIADTVIPSGTVSVGYASPSTSIKSVFFNSSGLVYTLN